MIQNKTQVETVNLRLYFKVIFRQNEIQYFTNRYTIDMTDTGYQENYVVKRVGGMN
jgi:hypothetical protein